MEPEFYTIVDKLIESALIEDVGDGDHTSLACVPFDAKGSAKLLVKEAGVISGVEIACRIFKIVDKGLEINVLINDGASVKPGDVVFTVSGASQSILKAERLVLNIMQRMSGISTNTKRYVDLLNGLKTKVLDTRKTSPGLRILEKMAVKIGGGYNHRFGLYDMILIKDNHVDFAGGIEKALSKTQVYLQKLNKQIPVEIEVRNFEELRKVLEIGKVNRIMLDNFSVEQTQKAVELIDGRFETESSGGINFNTIRQYAACGVDYVSVGELTHQIKSIDLSLKAI